MPSLSRDLRRQLEKTIAGENGARQIAEAGAEQSLQRLAVDRHEPHTSLTADERTLRTQLRAHGRQLGDMRDPQRGTQTITHLKQAVAYEHWHRMLFARFLAENDLLLHPEHCVALSLDEVKELALGLRRDWIEVAAEYAQRMLLREVFRPDDPALRVPLPPEKRLELEGRLNSLPREVFVADDSLGWVYQFWQKDAKEEVNRSEVKIGADELPSVTQLFTEDYMVLFLLENTLGAWWTHRHGSPSLPGYEWSYLRLDSDGGPAAGSFRSWPDTASQLRILDPCMGSGHFLTFALPILVRMRMAEENLTLAAAIAKVLRDNLFGLELDARCSQIAAFNLALTAWKLVGWNLELPALNLACSGLAINAKEADWTALAGSDDHAQEAMRKLYKLFSEARSLGSLIDPERLTAGLFVKEFAAVRPLLEQALRTESLTEESRELAIAAKGVLAAAQILSSRYTLVATNVPYLGRGRQDPNLAEYCDTFYPEARADLANCFVDRCLSLCVEDGSVALVTKQELLFQGSYEEQRRRLLRTVTWHFVAVLGPRAFETLTGERVIVTLLGVSRHIPEQDHPIVGWNAFKLGTAEAKAEFLRTAQHESSEQRSQLDNPDSRVVLSAAAATSLLGVYAESFQGIKTGDDPRMRRFFWEVPEVGKRWRAFQSTVKATCPSGGREGVVDWLHQGSDCARLQGLSALNRRGVAVSQSSGLPSTLYTGDLFDSNVAPVLPRNPAHLPAIWAFCRSGQFAREMEKIDPKFAVANSSVTKVPFDLSFWQAAAEEDQNECIPHPETEHPNQWICSGNPCQASRPLHVAVARLVGYKWPRQVGATFYGCPSIETDGLDEVVEHSGIVTLTAVGGKDCAADRLKVLLRRAFDQEYSLAQLLTKTAARTLETWLRDYFFEEHCRLFGDRPFVWHVWDGLQDGFHALVNYQLLDHTNLERLIFSYLGDWLIIQRRDATNGVEGADTKVAAAAHLQGELKKILEGEEPYDVFVRWKPLSKQPLGWEPDLNDGVRANIRPWITEAKLYRATKAGVLRVNPSVKYTKDRGKESNYNAKEFPWFKVSSDRINDHHLSLAEKRRARGLS